MIKEIPSIVVDKEKILNKGFRMTLTKIVGTIAIVEYFEGEQETHKVVEVTIDRLKLVE
jgi:hypothetical protein